MARSDRRVRVGIVGSGVAGAFSAHYVREVCGPEAEIVVFEREQRVGGRVAEMELAGLRVETGATLIHSSNMHLVRAIERLGLHATERGRDRHRGGGRGPRAAIWDGRAPVLELDDRRLPSIARMLARYGGSLLRAQRATRDMVERLGRVYEAHERGTAFATPEALLRHLGLYDLTQVEAYTFFRERGIGERFAREFSDPVARANYNQDGRLNAFVTLVSLAGGGLGGGRLFSVQEGNRRVVEGLLQRAGARVRTGDAVRRVELLDDGLHGRYRLTTAAGVEETCDAAILAVPLEFAEIEFQGVALPEAARARRPYQVTHTTFVAGRLRPEFFGWAAGSGSPARLILTVERPEIPFSALGWQGRATDGARDVYKIFSRAPLDDGLLDRMFADRSETVRMVWHAYPVLTPTASWPPFRLRPGLYYVNAMESAVSTMETEAIAARNVVNLMREDLAA